MQPNVISTYGDATNRLTIFIAVFHCLARQASCDITFNIIPFSRALNKFSKKIRCCLFIMSWGPYRSNVPESRHFHILRPKVSSPMSLSHFYSHAAISLSSYRVVSDIHFYRVTTPGDVCPFIKMLFKSILI